tara:strand:- start:31 stop:246 length:216 start_codon:yes stop_codon:yes gene_type:complete
MVRLLTELVAEAGPLMDLAALVVMVEAVLVLTDQLLLQHQEQQTLEVEVEALTLLVVEHELAVAVVQVLLL